MRTSRPIVLFFGAAALVWLLASLVSNAQGQGSTGSPVSIVALGSRKTLPTDAEGNPYLLVQNQAPQFMFDAESWQKKGNDVMPLLNGSAMPQQVVICGHRLSMIQGSMRGGGVDESSYFPLTLNGSAETMPNDGCFSVTPVAYLRIKGIIMIPLNQLTTAVVTARY